MIVLQNKLSPFVPKWKENNYIKKSARIIQTNFRGYRVRRDMDFLSYNTNIIDSPRILFLKDQKNIFKRMIKTLSPEYPEFANLADQLTINNRYRIIRSLDPGQNTPQG